MWCQSGKRLPRYLVRKGGAFPFFFARCRGALRERWHWVLLSVFASALLGLVGGYAGGSYLATAKLISTSFPLPFAPGAESAFPSFFTPPVEKIAQVIRSTELVGRAITASGLPITAERLATRFDVAVGPGANSLQVSVRDRNPEHATLLVNLLAQEAVSFLGESQSNEVTTIRQGLSDQATALDQNLALANEKLASFQRSLNVTDFEKEISIASQRCADLDQKSEQLRLQFDTLNLQTSDLLKQISQHHPALLSARQELNQALLRYTEEHPRVKKLRASLQLLEIQIAERGDQANPELPLESGSLAQTLCAKLIDLRAEQVGLVRRLEAGIVSKSQLQAKLKKLTEQRPEFVRLASECASLKTAREALARRQRNVQSVEEQLPAASRLVAVVRPSELSAAPKWTAARICAFGAGCIGLCLAGLVIFGLELSNQRIRSEDELARITELPVLGVLGDLTRMTAQEREDWAFTTLMALKGRLGSSGSQALVCGFISSRAGEGRSTWVELLAGAARRCGYQVLTISTSHPEKELPEHSLDPEAITPASDDNPFLPAHPELHSALMSPRLEPTLDIPVSKWVWNLENRRHWREAVRRWREMDNAAVFLDLPPASHSEAVLLSEEFSSLIWLCGKDMADISQTRAQLETLHYARSDLVGVVFNRATTPERKNPWARVVGLALTLALPFLSIGLSAQEVAPPAGGLVLATNGHPAFSISSPAQLADWQKRLTLGAGDVLNISLYEQLDSDRKGLIIGPDGRLNYLQARDVMASGLTIDELRAQLETVLGRFYRPPLRVIIVPQAYTSKKYYLLGNVVQKGVFPLDRPVTIIEAIAQAQGFVTTVGRRSTLMLADLPRAFLIRQEEKEGARRVNVDFEGLFLRGDLSQNISLAPGDYLYFPPLDLQELYVLGEVHTPGVMPYTPEMTVLRAIASHGGFTDRSYRKRVLVVRGSLTHPLTTIVDVSGILKAQGLDMKLEPRDIVYVSRKPWYKAEELLQSAISDFLRAAVVSWTGNNVGPFIKEPIF